MGCRERSTDYDERKIMMLGQNPNKKHQNAQNEQRSEYGLPNKKKSVCR